MIAAAVSVAAEATKLMLQGYCADNPLPLLGGAVAERLRGYRSTSEDRATLPPLPSASPPKRGRGFTRYALPHACVPVSRGGPLRAAWRRWPRCAASTTPTARWITTPSPSTARAWQWGELGAAISAAPFLGGVRWVRVDGLCARFGGPRRGGAQLGEWDGLGQLLAQAPDTTVLGLRRGRRPPDQSDPAADRASGGGARVQALLVGRGARVAARRGAPARLASDPQRGAHAGRPLGRRPRRSLAGSRQALALRRRRQRRRVHRRTAGA